MNELRLKGCAYNKEVKNLPSGKTITTFSIRVSNGKDKDGNYQNCFFNAKCWSEIDLEGLKEFEGRLAFDVWTDKEGKTQTRPYMLVNEIKGNEAGDSQPVDNLSDDVPFDF